MYRIRARDMLRFPSEDLFEMITGEFILVMDDGELVTNAVMTYYSSFAWVFHQQYPNTPLLKKHHIQHVLNGKRLSAESHLTLLGNALWSAYDAHEFDPGMDRDNLAQMLFRAMNQMYNKLSYRFEEYVVSMDITHFIEILDDPRIVQSKKELVPEPWSIKDAYRVLDEVLSDVNKFQNNPVVTAYRSKLVNANQLQQCIGPRGYVTDTDSYQFRFPIMRGYVEGLRSAYDSITESRSAAKALLFSKSNLREAEYFSRKLQLACMAVQNLHMGDCGSTTYLHWIVKGRTLDDDGELVSENELSLLQGKHYLDEATGTLKTIMPWDTHLVGQSVLLRSPIHCQHSDPNGICSTCFGALSLQVPKRSNIGHLCCVTMTEPSTQSVLSVKHLDGNASIDSVILQGAELQYLRPSRTKQAYLLNERLEKQSLKFVISFKDAPTLNDIMNVDDVEEYNISRISEMESILMRYVEGGQVKQYEAKVHMGKRKSSMSYPLLRHIKSKGKIELDAEGNYLVDMAGWNYSDPILLLPLRHFNMADHSKEISSLLQATKDQMQARDKTVRPGTFLVEFFNIVNSKLKVNLAALEVILYAIMIVSAENEDYRLPKPPHKGSLSVYDQLMSHRSLSATMAYQDHFDTLVSPSSYTLEGRADHLLDGILVPDQLYPNTI